MDLDDLQLMVAAAELGSLTAAAARLHVAQPAVSRRLARLERELGGPLFERGRGGARVTMAGAVLAEGASEVLAATSELERRTRDVLAGRSGRLRIGTTPTLGADLMPSALGVFRHAHPDVHLDVTSSGDSAWLATEVLDGRLDVGLAVLPESLDPALRVAVRGRQPFVLVVPTDHTLATAEPVPLVALVGERLVTLRASEGLRLLIDRIFVDLGSEPDVAIETTDRDMLMPLVAAGLGVTLLPEHFARRRLVDGVVLCRTEPAVERQVGAVVRRRDPSQLITDVVDALAGIWPTT